MKLAYLMTTPEAPPLPMCWNGEPRDVLTNLARIGYEGVELQVRDPAAFDTRAFAALVREAGLTVSGLSTAAAGSADNLYFASADADVRRKAVERFGTVLEFAHELGVDASISRMRGASSMAPDRATAMARFRAALEELLPRAERLGVRIVLEPMARSVCDLLNTLDETFAFIASLGSPALVYEADVHHQSMEERSLVASFVRGMRSGRMSYVQVCDSNRLAPGSGSVNFVDVVETLRAGGYDGWLAVECLQRPDSERCARQAFAVLRCALDGFRP